MYLLAFLNFLSSCLFLLQLIFLSSWVLKMQVTDHLPKELDLVAVVSWVVKMGIKNSVNGKNLFVMFTVSIILKRNATVKLHFSKSFF